MLFLMSAFLSFMAAFSRPPENSPPSLSDSYAKENLTKEEAMRFQRDLDEAERLIERGNYAKALGIIEKNQDRAYLFSKEAQSYFLVIRGAVKLSGEDAAGALADASEAIALFPSDNSGYFLRARARLAMQDIKGAETDASKAVVRSAAASPQLGDIYYIRAQTRLFSRKFKAAAADAEKAVQLSPGSHRGYAALALARFFLEDWEAAAAAAEEALALGAGQYMEAGARFIRAVSLFFMYGEKGETGLLYLAKAEIEALLNLPARILEDARTKEAFNLIEAPSSFAERAAAFIPDIASDAAPGAAQEKERGEIMDFLNALIALRPRSAAAYMMRGGLKAAMGDHSGAEEDLRRSLALSPDLTGRALVLLSMSHFHSGQPEAAIASVSEALDLPPESLSPEMAAELYYLRALFLYSLAEGAEGLPEAGMSGARGEAYRRSLRDLEAYLEQNPGDKKALEYMSNIKLCQASFGKTPGLH